MTPAKMWYTVAMTGKKLWLLCTFIVVLVSASGLHAGKASAESLAPRALAAELSAYDLIAAMNTLRMSYGLQPLIEDPIINAVAQGTAEIMAAQQLSWHIGDVKGRLAAAGYGGGSTVWATENFAVFYGSISVDQVMVAWNDESHMLPAVKPYYCNVGAGTAKTSDGKTYYILQAAYVAGEECGSYTSSGEPSDPGSGIPGSVPGIIVPVSIAEPNAAGQIMHEVRSGQSFWAIAVAYKTTIKDILAWNNLPEGTSLQVGDKLVIPGPNSTTYQTPTPMGFFSPSPPDQDGRIVHTVQAYQNLTSISKAYLVPIESILALNGLQINSALQIGQVLLILPGKLTPSPTARPLTPIEMLTPASDGKYYHTVGAGQNFIGIANYYGIALADLLAWNNMTQNYELWVGERLLLQVTPPATITPTPLPPTPIPSPTATTLPPTASPTLAISPSPTTARGIGFLGEDDRYIWVLPLGLALIAGTYLAISIRKSKQKSLETTGTKSSTPIEKQD